MKHFYIEGKLVGGKRFRSSLYQGARRAFIRATELANLGATELVMCETDGLGDATRTPAEQVIPWMKTPTS
jgi:hypothetical protein